MPHQRWATLKRRCATLKSGCIDVVQRLFNVVSTSDTRVLSRVVSTSYLFQRWTITLKQHWSTSYLFQRWTITLKQHWSDVEVLAGKVLWKIRNFWDCKRNYFFYHSWNTDNFFCNFRNFVIKFCIKICLVIIIILLFSSNNKLEKKTEQEKLIT